MPLNRKFCKIYHTSIVILHIIAGCVFVVASNIHDQNNFTDAIFLSIMLIILGTLCFGIFPIFCIAASLFTRFAPVIAFPGFIIMCVGEIFGDSNFEDYTIWQSLIGSVLLSLFGYFNIITALEANRDEDFNAIMVING